MSLSSASTPPRFLSVKGLSSPFRDEPAGSLIISHVIDISPSPPPSVLERFSGLFHETPSAGVDSLNEAKPSPLIKESRQTLTQESTIFSAKTQPIGLGLSIETAEGTFTDFVSSTEGLRTRTRPSNRRSMLSPEASFQVFQPIEHDAAWDSQDSWIEDGQREKDHVNAHIDEASVTNKIPSPSSPSILVQSPTTVSTITRRNKASKTTIPGRVTRRMLLSRPEIIEAPIESAPEFKLVKPTRRTLSFPSKKNPSVPLVPLPMKLGPRGSLLNTLRYRRGTPPNLAGSFSDTKPSGDGVSTSTSSPTDADDMILPYQAASAVHQFLSRESPLEVPSSPAFSIYSPTLRDTPGSFSPMIHEATFSPAMMNTTQAYEMPTHPPGTTLVFSILVGCLGFFGICLVLITLFWKRNIPGLACWKRRQSRGTAYDEFMEEKSCWVADKKLKAHRQSIPRLTKRVMTQVTPVPEVKSYFSDDENDVSVAKLRRGTSQAPSIPPLAHIVDGKLSIDSLVLTFPAPSSTSSSPFVFSSDNSCYEAPMENDYKVISTLKTRGVLGNDASLAQSDASVDTIMLNRNRSDSKSSIISKASIKSINSIASFLMNMTKFDSLSAAKKKEIPDLGISNETYKSERDSQHSVSQIDPFSKASPTPKKKTATIDGTVKRVGMDGGCVRSASVRLDKTKYSTQSPQHPKRPSTMSIVPPAILITDHPSELIPPSPPSSATYAQRPESIGTFLTRYCNFNDDPDTLVQTGEVLPSVPASSKSYKKLFDNPSTAFREVQDPRTNSVASIVSHRSRMSELRRASSTQGFEKPSYAKFDYTTQQFSQNTLTTSQTIRDLAAVTEDLRALVDSEPDPDCSWESPSQFHQSVPSWVTIPPNFSVAPPKRPPKSASRYSNVKPSAIEFESTSTPCSSYDSSPIRVPKFIHNNPNVNFETQSPSKVSRPPVVRKTNSQSSIETVLSSGSNSSLFEIASLHTAQSVRGASAEYVVRQSVMQSIETNNQLRMAMGTRLA